MKRNCLFSLAVVLTLLACDIGNSTNPVNPPMYADFKTKVQSNLPKAYSEVDKMYNAYFPTGVPGEVDAAELWTLNKSAVYYDPVKVLHEFIEGWGGNSGQSLKMKEYELTSAKILHEYYTRKATFDGFVRFPHGLAYLYKETGDQYYADALTNMATKSNCKSVNPANEYVAYSREVAYAIHVYIAVEKAGIPVANNTQILEHFVDMALSHLKQWHTAVFWRTDTEYKDYRQAFMVGITLNADLNMMVGPAYAWYANYTGDESYMDKAVDMWKAWVVNGYVSQADILWQAARYVNVFLKEYRKFYASGK